MATVEGAAGRDGARARWTRLAALGLILAALGPLLMLGAGIAWGLDDVPFFGISGFVALVGAYLVWRFGLWSKIVGIVVALLVAMALFWTAFGLATPSSFFDFVPGVLVIPGALLAIASCVGAIVAHRRGHLSRSAAGGERAAIRIAVAVVVVLMLLSGVLTAVGRETVDGVAGADVTVELSDFEFDRDEYSLAGGTTVLVKNSDPFLHTFTIDALDIDVQLGPGSEELVEIPDEPGSYILYCVPHTSEPEDPSEDDMAAHLQIE
ncbi:MAG: cupredoxin domain-containing protein [Actinomycetota bacterium]